MANKSFRLNSRSLKILNYFGRSQFFDTYTDVVILGLELVAKKYGFKLEPVPVMNEKKQKQSAFKSGLDKFQDSKGYQYKLATAMNSEELQDYQENYKPLGMSLKEYWVSIGKELL